MDFKSPIVLSQLDLPGDATDVDVDPRLNIAAVAAAAGGLAIVDVTDPSSPQLLRTLASNATQVEVFEGVAYANHGSDLRSYDLLTGERLQSLPLSGGNITGIAREGSLLYTIDDSRILRAVDLSTGLMVARGTLTMPVGGGKLFVGNGIAYVSAELVFTAGFATANVTNPNGLVLLSDVDNNSIAGKAVAANGSGLLVSVGNPGNAIGTRALDVSNVIDPADTGGFQTRFSLPQVPRSLAIGAGLAFVADGTGGLILVNYLPFDNQGVAPTVTINTTAIDVNPGVPGVQVIEGTTVAVQTLIGDDVQVRNVELLVNGQVVFNDVSFPFDLAAIAPNIQPGASTMEVRARATDTGGNVTTSAAITIDLVPDTFAPTLVATNVANGDKRGQAFRNFTVDFSEPMDTSTLTAANIRLVGPGGPVVPTNIQFRNGDRTVQLTYPALQGGAQQLVIDHAAITDRAGNALGAGTQTINFTIVPATTVWINPAGGFWDVASNWDTGVVPGKFDDVLVDNAGVATITYRSGTTEIRSLSSNNPLVITGGTLTVAQTVQVNNTFTLAGGTLRDATIIVGTGGQNLTIADNSNNRLDGVTIAGDLLLDQTNSVVRIRNGLNVSGAVRVSGDGASLAFEGTQTWSTGNVVFEGTTGGRRFIEAVNGSTTLTLGAGVTIHGGYGDIGGSRFFGNGFTLINNGALTADVSGQSLDIFSRVTLTNNGTITALAGTTLNIGAATWTNTGTIQATDATLNVGGAWSNTGTIAATNSTVNLGGIFTTAGLGAFNRTLGTVNLTGTLTNTGDTFTFNAATGSWNLAGGTVLNGALVFQAGESLRIPSNFNNRLDGVAITGDLLLDQTNSVVRIRNGLNVSGVVRVSGDSASLAFEGTQTWSTGNVVFEGTTGGRRFIEAASGNTTLTLGAGVTIHGGYGDIGGSRFFGNGFTLINNGALTADVSGQSLDIFSRVTLTNNGHAASG